MPEKIQQSSLTSSGTLSTANLKSQLILNQNSNGFRQILSVITNSSLTVKTFGTLIIFTYLLQLAKTNASNFLCVIPGKLLPPNFWIWTLVTHSFVEHSIVQVFIDMFVILLYSKMVEPLWGSRECIVFYFLITTIVALCTTTVYFIAFTIKSTEEFLFDTEIHGLAGVIGGFCVAIKQLMPDTLLLNFSIVRLKQDDLPFLFFLITFVLFLVKLVDFVFLAMCLFGIYASWIYLRFYQVHNNGNRGDTSASFSFASFFPTIFQPFVGILSNTIFNVFVMLKICKQPPKRYNVGAPSQLTINLSNSSGIDQVDAERRRQKALKALNLRMNKTEDKEENQQWIESQSDQQTSQTRDEPKDQVQSVVFNIQEPNSNQEPNKATDVSTNIPANANEEK